MGIVTEMPTATPQNDLDNVPDDLLGPAPATIRLSGKDLLVMDKPPEMGEFVKMEVTMRCKDDGRTLLADGGIGHYRIMSFVAAKVTAEPYRPEPEEVPVPDDDQESMLDETGQIPDDEGEADGEQDDLDAHDPEFSNRGE